MAERSFQLQQEIRHNAQELGDFLKELNTWENDIKRKDDELKRTAEIEKIVPPIRRSTKKGPKSSSQKGTKLMPADKTVLTQKQRISSYDYDAWSKFDVDSACRDVDVEEKEDSENDSDEGQQDLETTLEAEKQRRLQQAEFEKDKGNSLFKDGKYEAAINRYTIAADLNPQSSIILANRAMALLKVERYAAAEVDCTKALELDPEYAKAVARRATARTKLKKYKEAIEDQQRLLELQPNNKQAKLEITKLEKELSKIEKTKQTSNASRKPRKPLKRIIIEDIGSDSDEQIDESSSHEANHIPKKQLNQRNEPKEDKKQINMKAVNGIEEDQTKESLLRRVNNLQTAEDLPSDKHFSAPTTAVQFETEFKKLKKNSTLFYEYFKIIPPSSYKALFHHCIDDVIPIAIECIHSNFIRDQRGYWEELVALTSVPRFDMAVMFLSQSTKRAAEDIFRNLLKDLPKKIDAESVSKLAKRYSVVLEMS